MSWRKIKCPFTHEPFYERICINGVLYYKALQHEGEIYKQSDGIVCFDVRSEKFKFVDAYCLLSPFIKLINYKGKLCGINLKYHDDDLGERRVELHMWVLEHVEKQEWSKYAYTLWDENEDDVSILCGMTATGEIVLSKRDTFDPFILFYFNPDTNTLRRVEIQGFGANREAFESYRCVYAFVDDYVEDFSVNVSKKLKSSRVKQDLNIENNLLQSVEIQGFGANRESIGDDYVEDLSVNIQNTSSQAQQKKT